MEELDLAVGVKRECVVGQDVHRVKTIHLVMRARPKGFVQSAIGKQALEDVQAMPPGQNYKDAVIRQGFQRDDAFGVIDDKVEGGIDRAIATKSYDAVGLPIDLPSPACDQRAIAGLRRQNFR